MKTAVVTMCFGEEYGEIAKLSHPTMKAYADKIGAEFHAITERKFHNVNICYEKLQMRYLDYDRILYVDTDCVITPHAPNIFDYLPYGWFGAFCEGKYLGRMAALAKAHDDWGYNGTAWRLNYFNAGVMVFDRSHYSVFDPPPVFHENFGDQTWMNIQVARKFANKFLDIGPHWNWISFLPQEERMKSFIIHYAGGPHNRARLVQDLSTASA